MQNFLDPDGVDFKKNPSYNIVLSPSGFPINPKVSQLHYYNGLNDGLHVFDGTNWIKCGPSGPITWNQRNHIEVTYTELINTHWGYLEPGLFYLITDLIEPLMVMAVMTNKMSHIAYSTDYPEDVIYYDVLMNNITYRQDTINSITSYYDWRNVKFIRWNKGSEVSGHYTGLTDTGFDFEEYFTFNGITSNISLGHNTSNIVFYGSCRDSVIGDNSQNCSIGDNFYYNYIGRNFSNNYIGDDFNRNTIDDDFHNNIVDDGFTQNKVSYAVYNNQFKSKMIKNILGHTIHDNIMDLDFQNNILGDEIYGNQFGKNFTYNEIADRFQNNIFAINSNRNKFLLDSINGVNFGTKANRRLDIGYSDIEITKTVVGTILDITNEWWAGRIYIANDSDINTILFTQDSHPLDIIPMLGINIRLVGTSTVSGLNGDILMPTVDLKLKGDTGDRVTLLKDSLGRFRQVTGIDYR